MIKFIKNMGFNFSMLYNRKLLLRIANMPADGTVAHQRRREAINQNGYTSNRHK